LCTAAIAIWLWQTRKPTRNTDITPQTPKQLNMDTLSQCYQTYLVILREQKIAKTELTEYLDASDIELLEQLEAHLYQGSEQTLDLMKLKKTVAKLASRTKKQNTQQTGNSFNLYTPV